MLETLSQKGKASSIDSATDSGVFPRRGVQPIRDRPRRPLAPRAPITDAPSRKIKKKRPNNDPKTFRRQKRTTNRTGRPTQPKKRKEKKNQRQTEGAWWLAGEPMNDRGIGPTHVGICHGGTQGNNGTQSGNQFNEPSPRAKKNKKSPVNGRVTKRKKNQTKNERQIRRVARKPMTKP